ncbi:hypothetical protein DFP72DRAFT_1082604 [Ephemerocybe angulata]|uniref:Uncharacterized protein n=1 Tax=Ephemerocybe angulata TaxID=980116 RepID=A0A8H6LVA8_9AGAR|nr:hypothetical protein DFP72DRAFT_1082604 [Tulosesus angulatus]
MNKHNLDDSHEYEGSVSKRSKINMVETPKGGGSASHEKLCLRRFRVPHGLHRMRDIDLEYRNSYLVAEEVDVHGRGQHQEVDIGRDDKGFFSGKEAEEYLFDCWRFSLQMIPREPCEVQARAEGLRWTDIEDRHRVANAGRYELGGAVEEERRVLFTVRSKLKRWKALKKPEEERWERATRVAASALALPEREELEWRTESRDRWIGRLKHAFRENERRQIMPYDLSYEDRERVEEWSSDDDV